MSLTKREAERLCLAWQRDGDERARETLIRAYAPMVRAIVVRWPLPRCVDWEDLVSAGTLALVAATDRFDPRRGAFSTYAWVAVRGAVIDELRGMDWAPRRARKNGEEIAAVFSLEKWRDAFGHDDVVADGPDPERFALARERVGVFRDAFKGLPDLQAALIAAFHFDETCGRKLAETLGVSPSRVSQHLRLAREHLAEAMADYDETDMRRAA